jgi:hypothetical protein
LQHRVEEDWIVVSREDVRGYELRREKRSDRQASGREATHKKKGGGAEREVEKIGSAGRL